MHHCRVSSSELSTLLQLVRRRVATSSNTPILTEILFEVEDQFMYVTGGDSELRVRGTITLQESDGNFSFTARPQDIVDYIKDLPDQPLSLDFEAEQRVVSVNFTGGFFKFSSSDPDLYPRRQVAYANASGDEDGAAPEIESSPEKEYRFQLDVSTLYTGIAYALPVVHPDPVRKSLATLCLDVAHNELKIAGSDGVMLTRFNTTIQNDSTEKRRFLVSLKSAQFIHQALAKYTGEVVSICVSERMVSIELPMLEISTLLADFTYPNYESIIPQDNPYTIEVDKALLQSSLGRMDAFMKQDTTIVCELKKGQISLTVQDDTTARTAQESVVANMPEDFEMLIAFNLKRLLTLVGNISTSSAILQLGDPSKTVLVLPTDNSEKQQVLNLIAPMPARR